MLAEAPAPMPEEADAAPGANVYGAVEEAAEAVDSGSTCDTNGLADQALIDALSVFTLESPGQVPAERAADFEALLRDAGVTPGGERTVLCYIEYRGVIYEFSSDGAHLCWRDAAEGMPAASPGSLYELAGITLS